MTTPFEMPTPLRDYQKAYRHRVIVLGCGGTGGYLVPSLARLIANLDRSVELILLDGDKVEAKNLGRQNFISPDLGRYKAEVLAERYSAAFGMQIHFVPEYLKSKKTLTQLTKGYNEPGAAIVIGCVDNHRTRREVAKWFRSRRGRVWIDAGNEEMNGQVVCGYNQLPFDPSNRDQLFGLPCVADLFTEVDKDRKAKFNDELSCAERAISAPQNIATNLLAANYLLTFTQQVLLGEPLHTHGVFFSADRSTTDAMLNVPSRLNVESWPGYKRPKRKAKAKAKAA